MKMNSVVPIGLATSIDERLKLALDAMPVGVTWIRLSDGCVEFTNSKFVEMFGDERGKDDNVSDVIRLIVADPHQSKTLIAAMQNVIGQNILERMTLPTEEFLVIGKGGREFFASMSGVVVPEANMSIATFMDISESKARETILDRFAKEDALTGLLNRRAFDAAIAELVGSREAGMAFCLIMMDLDGFKAVNDVAGHDAGDTVLRDYAHILKRSFRPDDIVARWGGDEFVVLLKAPEAVELVDAALDRIRSALRDLAVSSGFHVGVSIGVSRFPQDAQSVGELYRLADEAMFRAKRETQALRSAAR